MPAPGRSPSPVLLGAAAVVLLVGLAAGLVVWGWDRPSALDRFYEPPDAGEVEAAERGTVLREQPVGGAGTGAEARRVLFRSVGADGAPAVASGVVAWPASPPPEGGFPVVAIGHRTVGLADRCAPSRDGLDGDVALPAIAFLEAGFAVAMPDLPGLGPPDQDHAYLVGEPTGRQVVDAVRALRDLAGDRVGDRVVAWGSSQGGHAVLWARALAADDAPELDWRATAAVAPVVDLATLAEGDDDLAPVLAVAVAMGRATQGLDLDAVLTDDGGRVRQALEDGCVERALSRSVDLDGPVLAGDRAWLEEAAAEEAPPPGGAGPALVAYGDADVTVGRAEVAAWVGAAGPEVEGLELPGVDHGGAEEAAGPDVVRWLLDHAA